MHFIYTTRPKICCQYLKKRQWSPLEELIQRNIYSCQNIFDHTVYIVAVFLIIVGTHMRTHTHTLVSALLVTGLLVRMSEVTESHQGSPEVAFLLQGLIGAKELRLNWCFITPTSLLHVYLSQHNTASTWESSGQPGGHHEEEKKRLFMMKLWSVVRGKGRRRVDGDLHVGSVNNQSELWAPALNHQRKTGSARERGGAMNSKSLSLGGLSVRWMMVDISAGEYCDYVCVCEQ